MKKLKKEKVLTCRCCSNEIEDTCYRATEGFFCSSDCVTSWFTDELELDEALEQFKEMK